MVNGLGWSFQIVFSYNCTDFYHPEDEGGIRYDDPQIGVDWPISEDMQIILSEKDKHHESLADQPLVFDYNKLKPDTSGLNH